MPRLGVPSTTDSARVMADVCGEPAPLPRSTNPRHNDRPGGTFPRVVQRLIETSKKGRKEGAWRPHPGAKAPPSSGRAMVAVSCPAPISNERKLSPRCNPDGPGRPREAIDFSKRPPRAGAETEGLRCFVDFGHGRDQVRDQTQDLAIALGRDETHKICEAEGVGAKNRLAAAPSWGSPGSPSGRPGRGPIARIRLKLEGHVAQIIPSKLTVLPRIGAS